MPSLGNKLIKERYRSNVREVACSNSSPSGCMSRMANGALTYVMFVFLLLVVVVIMLLFFFFLSFFSVVIIIFYYY